MHPLVRGRAGWSVVVLAALSLCLSDVPNGGLRVPLVAVRSRGMPLDARMVGSRLPAPQLALRGAGDAGADNAEPDLTREEVAEMEKALDKLRWGPVSEDRRARVRAPRRMRAGGAGAVNLFPGAHCHG